MDRYIPANQYDHDTAQTNTRLSRVESQTNMIEDRINRVDNQVRTTTTDMNTHINFYSDMIYELQKRIEALEKHTLINMPMPTHDELNEFLEGGDTH